MRGRKFSLLRGKGPGCVCRATWCCVDGASHRGCTSGGQCVPTAHQLCQRPSLRSSRPPGCRGSALRFGSAFPQELRTLSIFACAFGHLCIFVEKCISKPFFVFSEVIYFFLYSVRQSFQVRHPLAPADCLLTCLCPLRKKVLQFFGSTVKASLTFCVCLCLWGCA